MDLKKVNISEVKPWDKNPRNIKTEDFKRLKRQIKDLGVYKPLVVFEENGHYVALGGNMRLRALRDMKIPEVEVSIVKAETEAEKVAYSLSDNDRAGEYDELALTELLYSVKDELDLGDFKIDLGPPIDISALLDAAGPNGDGPTGEPRADLISIVIEAPENAEKELIEWLRYGEKATPEGLGRGVLKRSGIG